jgi:hypothetical protein
LVELDDKVDGQKSNNFLPQEAPQKTTMTMPDSEGLKVRRKGGSKSPRPASAGGSSASATGGGKRPLLVFAANSNEKEKNFLTTNTGGANHSVAPLERGLNKLNLSLSLSAPTAAARGRAAGRDQGAPPPPVGLAASVVYGGNNKAAKYGLFSKN